MESSMREYERKMEDLAATVHSLRNSERDSQGKAQKLEL